MATGTPKISRIILAAAATSTAVLGLSFFGLPTLAEARTTPTVSQAKVLCDRAIASDKTVSATTIRVCNIANVPSRHDCSHGAPVWEAYIPTGYSALLRVGHRPRVYSESNFYLSEEVQLCGDSVDPMLTPPKSTVSTQRVKALVEKALRSHQS
jgi:hypothetical protein